jgi:hypothetical protein
MCSGKVEWKATGTDERRGGSNLGYTDEECSRHDRITSTDEMACISWAQETKNRSGPLILSRGKIKNKTSKRRCYLDVVCPCSTTL